MLLATALALRTASSIAEGLGNTQILSRYLFLRAPLRMIVAPPCPARPYPSSLLAHWTRPETRLPPRNSQFYEMPVGSEKVQVPQNRRDLGGENASEKLRRSL